MTINAFNLKVTGVFEINLDNGDEMVSDTSDPDLEARQLELMNALIDELQAYGFSEIHIETSDTSSMVHKVGSGDKFDESDNPSDYELFATIREWGSVIVEKAHSDDRY